MIPLPKLDDRKWEDLVREAIDLIPKYCPEWTNHNASDPGITLLELFAWLIEVLLYRLNRVGDKNYLAFLNLMGIDLQPPQPATATTDASASAPAMRSFFIWNIKSPLSLSFDTICTKEPLAFQGSFAHLHSIL